MVPPQITRIDAARFLLCYNPFQFRYLSPGDVGGYQILKHTYTVRISLKSQTPISVCKTDLAAWEQTESNIRTALWNQYLR